MSLIYITFFANFSFLVISWILSYRIFKKKTSPSDQKMSLEIEQLKKDLILVTKNPAAARRKLKSGE